MKKATGTIVATLGLLALVAAGGTLASSQTAERQSAAASTKAETVQLQAAAERATAGVQASPGDQRMLVEAVRGKNIDIARSVLLKTGFNTKQLEGARIAFKDTTGGRGGAEKIKVTISASCCPATISITIQFK